MGVKRYTIAGEFAPAGEFNTLTAAAATDGGGVAHVLTENTDRWLDADNGSDSHDGTSSATAWKTLAPFAALLNHYAEINGCYLRLRVLASTAVPQLVRCDLPVLRNTGVVAIIGESTLGMKESDNTTDVIVTADETSTTESLNVASWPSAHDATGWQIVCTAGANVGARRQVLRFVGGGEVTPASLIPSQPFDADGVGDTWAVVRPAASINAPDFGAGFFGVGVRELQSSAGDSGLYLANLRLTGQPSFLRTSAMLFGVEYSANESTDFGTGLLAYGGAALIAGSVSADMPWLGPTSGLWSGYGLTMLFEEQDASTGDVLNIGGGASFTGFLLGSTLITADYSTKCTLSGSRLWGQAPGGSGATVAALYASYVEIGTAGSSALDSRNSGDVVNCSQPLAIVKLGDVALSSATTKLLRASNGGLITIESANGAPAGETTLGSAAQDASGGGTISWDSEPELTAPAGVQLKVDGATGLNTLLATAPSAFRDASGQDAIVRRT